ncbi:MAG: DUF2723 domain-containing protein [Candidatus Promineifilaceae bacterium]|nr:DUF2723 domain-containing protein [Candidatus Promineifilaceae bacterium]
MRTRIFPFVLFFLLLAFYAFTLQPSLAWGDGIRLQREAISAESFILAEMVEVSFAPDPYPFARLGVAAWDHPLYVMVGHTLVRLLPTADPLWLVNFLSALFGAGAAGVLYLWLVRRTGSPMAATFAALALAVSHTFWWHATTPEVYTLFAILQLLTIFLYDLYQQRGRPAALYGAAFTLGLGAANHLLALLLLPAAVLWALLPEPIARSRAAGKALRQGGRRRLWARRRWLLAALFFLLGFSPYLIQFLRMMRTFPPARVLGPAVGATFLRGSLATTPGALAESIVAYVTFLVYQFNPAGVALGVYGWWAGRRSFPTLWKQAAALYAVYLAFGVVYAVSDQFAFFLPAHVFWAGAMGMGAARWLARVGNKGRRWAAAGLALLVVVMPPLYEVAPDLLRAAGVTEEAFGIPQIGSGVRDGLDYYLNPNRRGDRAAYAFGRETLQALPAEAVIIAEWYTDTDEFFVFRYFAAIEGVRPDVEVVGWPTVDPFAFDAAMAVAMVEEHVGRRPVYLASLSEEFYGASTLAERYCIVPEDNLYRIYVREEEATAAPKVGRPCVSPGSLP